MITTEKLIEQAFKARQMAYAPYSGFEVGAALLCKDGSIYTGCNIESAAYSPTNCAERTAFFKAVSEGKREFSAIAVVGAKQCGDPYKASLCTPCGVCLQVMAEFCQPESFRIVAVGGGSFREFLLKELLPMGFGRGNLA